MEAEVLKLEGEAIDLRGKQENYIAQLQEIREMKAALEKAEKDLGDLKTDHAEEKRKLEDEVRDLKLAITPDADEPESTWGLITRAELVARIRKLGDDVFKGAKYSWENTLALLQIVNLNVKLNTEGTGMLCTVENGQIVIPDKYKQMEMEAQEKDLEEEGDDGNDEDNQECREEGHGESDG
ncbi:hypothetical protein A2U01_0040126 [Trifolium medium]|uniref:Uncharacterized protein n=1 Tax=Trifolium medium TaxID=97028 RepID=A0A392Q3S7_9FABA|nr:hypothetical protein [Trifolium medium]